MFNLKSFITEQRNVHMEHLEDNVLNAGVDGAKRSLIFLTRLVRLLSGHSRSKLNISTKWDGAPAIFAGIDPRDGKFFVAKKGVFAKNPKVYKTNKDIDADTSGDLAAKLKIALKHLPELKIKGVIQGDLLYSKSSLKKVNINGEPHLSFHPNTIVYTVPMNTPLSKEMLASKLGIVWHTQYQGNSFEDMHAVFGQPIAMHLAKSKNVWFTDAVYKDVSGSANFTANETKDIRKDLNAAIRTYKSIDKKMLNDISNNHELVIRVKAFYNTYVRAGEVVNDTKSFTRDLVNHIMDYYTKQASTKKTERGKAVQFEKQKSLLKHFVNPPKVQKIFDLMLQLNSVKLKIVDKLNKNRTLNTFLLTDKGYQVTSPEGYVAIDHLGKNAVKLVDRLNFSYANFSPNVKKGWTK